MTPKHFVLIAASLASVCLTPLTQAQSGTPRMPWQRNLSDALAISKRTGKPLLLCVNMNGEVACERIAAGRYRNPAFVALAAKFVPVLASPNRHNERDYDEHGHRIPCPKFGRITCREHIDIEPALYKRYFNERRVAPRHVGVSSDGKPLFDLFLLPRLGVIDDTLKTHGEGLEAKSTDYDALDLKACLNLSDHEARLRVEKAYADGDEATRLSLAAMAGGGKIESPEILRLAMRDERASIRNAAQKALAKTSSADLLPLFIAAIAECEVPETRQDLIAALARIAEQAPDTSAKQSHKFLSGVYGQSTLIDLKAWKQSLDQDAGEGDRVTKDDDLDALDAKLNQLGEDLNNKPGDIETLLALAKTNLHYGQVLALQGSDPTFIFEDARSSSKRALKLDPDSALARAYIAQVAYLLSEKDAAKLTTEVCERLAQEAQAAIAATTLKTFAKLRTQALYKAIGEGTDWPTAWISDIHAAYTVIGWHSAGTEDEVAAHTAFLAYLKAYGEEQKAIATGLERFGASTKIHQSLRTRLLREGGPQQLEAAYAKRVEASPRSPDLQWFAGYASLVAAEQWVGKEQRDQAIASYGRSIASFQASFNLKPSYRSSAVHFSCLALAGRGRVHLEAKRYKAATEDLSAAARMNPGSVDWQDGLGKTPRATARLLRRSLRDNGKPELADALEKVWRDQEVSLN